MKKFYFFLVTLFTLNGAIAQWTQQNSVTAYDLRSVHFVDANKGFAVGDSGTILKTIDGGATWNYVVSGTIEQLNSVFFVDATTGYTVGWNTNDTTSTILKSSDSGFSWHNSSTGANWNFESIYFTDAENGYAAGGGGVWGSNSGKVYKTINGGLTWSEIFSHGFKCIKISFTSPDTGFVVSWDTGFGDVWYEISKTSDAGLTWNTFSLGGMNEIVSDVCFTNFNTGFGVGPSGKIIKTTNGGSSWTSLSSGTSENLNSVFFIDSLNGYAVGDNAIVHTLNGGVNWTSQNMTVSGALLSVNFPRIDTGYAVGDNGIILKTTNGGGLGFNEISVPSTQIKVYPNPAINLIMIESSPTVDFHLSILNVNGQKLIEKNITDQKTYIDISKLPAGVFFVNVENRNTIETRKLIKQ